MRIALFFGSFNPVHNGHLAVGQYAVDHALADQVWYVVSPHNPLKRAEELAPFEDRVQMVRLALREALPNYAQQLVVCDVESTLPLPSYTYHTVCELQRSYPEHSFVILCGSDIERQLDRWYRIEDLRRLVRFVVYPRQMDGQVACCSDVLREAPLVQAEATHIRNHAARGEEDAWGLLPSSVAHYIKTNKLYDTMNQQTTPTAATTAQEYFDQGRACYQQGDFAGAINNMNRALDVDPDFTPALELKEMLNEILDFRCVDIYNP